MGDEQKFRYCAFLVYPDSAPDDWVEQLKRSHGSYAISPLHESDSEVGKPHFHVIYRHGNTCGISGLKRAIPAGVPANGYVEGVSAPRNYQRYLVHLDDPDKQQWQGDPRELITVLNGFPLDLSRDFSRSELQEQRKRIFELSRENGIDEYADLLDGLMDVGEWDLWEYACNHTVLFTGYFSSVRGRKSFVSGHQQEERGEDGASQGVE